MSSLVYVSTGAHTAPAGQTAVAAVFRTGGDERPRVLARRLRPGDRVPAAYRALLLALWDARRAGARHLVISTDDPEVVAHLDGQAPPPAEAVGVYLQVRALVHAFDSAQIRYVDRERNFEAISAAASAALHRRPVSADLPLWRAAS